jgi:hypothetical protein
MTPPLPDAPIFLARARSVARIVYGIGILSIVAMLLMLVSMVFASEFFQGAAIYFTQIIAQLLAGGAFLLVASSGLAAIAAIVSRGNRPAWAPDLSPRFVSRATFIALASIAVAGVYFILSIISTLSNAFGLFRGGNSGIGIASSVYSLVNILIQTALLLAGAFALLGLLQLSGLESADEEARNVDA